MKNAKNEKWACKWHFILYRDRKVSENMNINPTLLTNWVPAKATFPVFVQPKWDGVRCIATAKGLFTRNGKRIACAPHISFQLGEFFATFPEAFLDGELVHPAGVQATTSAVMGRRPVEELAYHVFDACLHHGVRNLPYHARLLMVLPLIDRRFPGVHLIDCKHAGSVEEVRTMHSALVAEGFEGAVIRDPVAPYCEGRTDKVQKLKVHQDAEYRCVAAAEGILTFELKDGRKFLAQGGASFDASPVGKLVTVRFNGLTDDGIPRHAVAVCIRAD